MTFPNYYKGKVEARHYCSSWVVAIYQGDDPNRTYEGSGRWIPLYERIP